jgi:DNA-binding Lrp family transcriptional regulator
MQKKDAQTTARRKLSPSTPQNPNILRKSSHPSAKPGTTPTFDHMAPTTIAFTSIKLKCYSNTTLTSFEKNVIHFPEVMECYRITGVADFLLKIAIRDVEAYDTFLNTRLATLPNIGSVITTFVLVETRRP